MWHRNFELSNLKFFKEDYLNFSEKDLNNLKKIASNLSFVLKNLSQVIFSTRQSARKILEEICSELGISLEYDKIEKIIREQIGKTKQERKELFISILEKEFRERIKLEIESVNDLEQQVKKLKGLIYRETNERKRVFYMKRVKELQTKINLIKNSKYENFMMQIFLNKIKELDEQIDKFVGKVMKIDVLENDRIRFQEKYEVVITKIADILRKMKI